MKIPAMRRFALRGILLSSALVMFSGAATAAEIEICTPSGPTGQTCEVLSLATPVAHVPDGTSATWDAVFENSQFLQLPGTATSLTLSLGFETNAFSGDVFFDAFGVPEFYLTDANGDEILGLTADPVVLGGSGFSRTWTGLGLQGLAVYDFHASCNDCADAAAQFEVVLSSYSFELTADGEASFTIGPAAVAAPAPASLALLGLGLIAVGGWSRRRQAA